MFTGIVNTVGTIREIDEAGEEGRRFCVGYEPDDPLAKRDLSSGCSVSVDGVCLTAKRPIKDGFWADVSGETLDRTTLKERSEGDPVNLEPALRAGDEMGGHFVTGHVDDVAEIVALSSRGEYHDLRVRFRPEYRCFIAPKGSVALDGMSLTVNEVTDETCTVRIIPHTFQQTTLSCRKPGDRMNLEVDMLSRYVYNYLSAQSTPSGSLSRADLADAGFE